MLSYRHGFHAGNYADVLKHWVLMRTLQYIVRKDKPAFYLETHAGRGMYSLIGATAAYGMALAASRRTNTDRALAACGRRPASRRSCRII